jgi:hypothetical protein
MRARQSGALLQSQLLGGQRLGGSRFKASPGKKVSEIPCQRLDMVGHTHNPSDVGGIGKRIKVQGRYWTKSIKKKITKAWLKW